jgi:hypothetical protein
MAWYWCVYVQLPEGHRCIGKSYEDDELRDAPFELTWSEGNEFGLDHGRSWDGKPHIHYSEFTPEYELRNSGKYTTYDDAVAEAKELKAFFVSKA